MRSKQLIFVDLFLLCVEHNFKHVFQRQYIHLDLSLCRAYVDVYIKYTVVVAFLQIYSNDYIYTTNNN
jgi:hypothetical protein